MFCTSNTHIIKDYVLDPITKQFYCNDKGLKDIGVNVFAAKSSKSLNLTTLQMQYNIIEVLLEDQFIDLRELRYLHLENNNISTIGVGLFRYNIKLKEIYLSNNNIDKFDFKLRILKRLDTLDLDYNHLTTLNADVFEYFLDKENEGNLSKSLNVLNNLFTCDCSMTWIRHVDEFINFYYNYYHMCTSDISLRISLACFIINVPSKGRLTHGCLYNNFTDCMTSRINEIR